MKNHNNICKTYTNFHVKGRLRQHKRLKGQDQQLRLQNK